MPANRADRWPNRRLHHFRLLGNHERHLLDRLDGFRLAVADQRARHDRRHARVGKRRDLVVDGHDLSRRAAVTGVAGRGMALVVSREGLSLSRPSVSMPEPLDVQAARPTADNPRHARKSRERILPRYAEQTEGSPARADPKVSR